ncbi:unnamed protein product [Meloidogyne enterolobii]|uniref:Uncharacterized protein n=1 Tax=Meloidogyne enterolobii TaxID=390850 RepID=A0ACB0Y9B9_MELEN
MKRYRNFFTSFRGRFLLPLILINIFIFITFFYSFFSSRPQQLVERQNIELYSQPARLKEPISKPLILMWTNIFRQQTMQLESDCPLASLCELTYNRSFLPKVF